MTDLEYGRDSMATHGTDWEREFEVERRHWENERAQNGPERCVDVTPILRRIKRRKKS
jgi:hypothetical protein